MVFVWCRKRRRERQRLHSGRISFLEGVSDAMLTKKEKRRTGGGDASLMMIGIIAEVFFRPALPEKVIAAEQKRVTHG